MPVYHIVHRLLSDAQRAVLNGDGPDSGWNGALGKSYLRAEDGDIAGALALGMYRPVGIVKAESFEDAYLKTQHMHWPNGAWNTPSREHVLTCEDSAKSSSVGDIFVEDHTGKVRMVAHVGFELIPFLNAHSVRNLVENYRVGRGVSLARIWEARQ